jgi:hypothetical protein
VTSSEAQARPLQETERSVLDALLSHEFDGVEELRKQATGIRAVSSCGCGCGSIGLVHEGGYRPPRDSGVTLASTEGTILNDSGESIGWIILFLREGLLDDLEVSSFSGEPLAMPSAAHVQWTEGLR